MSVESSAPARPLWRDFLPMVLALAIVAWLAPAPDYDTDRGTYEAVGRQLIVPDCSGLHCFRLLVAWVVESAPGPSLAKWKAYAVLANAGAGMAVIALATLLGLSARGARLAGWISALGFGSLFTLFDPHTSDPLMYLLGPLLMTLLLGRRVPLAAGLATVGILAKEFAAAPLWIFAIAQGLARRWGLAGRVLLAAAAVTFAWIGLQLWLMLAFNYSYGDSASADLFGGGYIRLWMSYVSPAVAAATIFGEFGALFLLMPFGFLRSGPELRRLVVSSFPAIVALAYVQQPDRALWNFHFLAIPLAVIVLDRLPGTLAWAFVAAHAAANLRLGAQLPFAPPARYALAVSMGLAVLAIVRDLRGGRPLWRPRGTPPALQVVAGGPASLGRRAWWPGVAALLLAYGAALILIADMRLHRSVENQYGINIHGYRGPVARQSKVEDRRVLVLGDHLAFGTGLVREESVPAYLERNLNQKWRQGHRGLIATVVNLAGPGDGPRSYLATLRDYEALDGDVVCLIVEGPSSDAMADVPWRHRSPVFRATGYFPLLPDRVWSDGRSAASIAAPRHGNDRAITAATGGACDAGAGICAGVVQAVGQVLATNRRAMVVRAMTMDAPGHDLLRATLDDHYGHRADVRYLDVAADPELAALVSRHAGSLTAHVADRLADFLTTPILEMLP